MAGRNPSLDGEKANEGGRAISLTPVAPRELAKAPADFDRWAKMAWDQIVKSLAPHHLLSHGDLLALEIGCKAWGRWKRLEREIDRLNKASDDRMGGEIDTTPNGHDQLSALRIAADRAAKQYHGMAGQFGLTPVARIKTAGTAQGDLFEIPSADGKQDRKPDAIDPTDPFASLRLN